MPNLAESELRKIRGAQIGMVFQDAAASLCPIRTIGDQIYESMAAHGKISRAGAEQKALALFDKLGFEDARRVWSSYPFELSGGMNQRVAIAMAALMEPRVLLADEPTSALDVSVQRQVLRELEALRAATGAAIVLVTHDIGVVSAVADTVLVLRDGRVEEYGSAESVLRRPASEYTRRLLDAAPRLRRS